MSLSSELSAEAVAALIALVNEHHGQEDQALARPLAEWAEWLDSEGYGSEGLASFFLDQAQLEHWHGGTSLEALYANAIDHDLSTEKFIEHLREREADYLDQILAAADQILANNRALLSLAGGTGRGLNRTDLSSGGKWGIRGGVTGTVILGGIALLIYKRRRRAGSEKKANLAEQTVTSAENHTTHQIQTVASRDETSPERLIDQAETIRYEEKELKAMNRYDIEKVAKKFATRDIEAMLSGSDWESRAERLIAVTEKLDNKSYELLTHNNQQYFEKAIKSPGVDSQKAIEAANNNVRLMNFSKRYEALKLNPYIDETNPTNIRVAKINSKTFEEFRNNMIETTKHAYEKMLTDEVKKARKGESILEKEKENFEEKMQKTVEEQWHVFRAEAIEELNNEMKAALERAAATDEIKAPLDVKAFSGVNLEESLEDDVFI